MGKSSDELRQEIDQQRSETGEKINQMEQQVQDQGQHAREQVMDTAEQVRGEAQAFVNDTVETVKENADFQQQIQERPLVAAGAALVGGFLLGGMMGGGGGQQGSHQQASGAYTSSSGQQSSGQSGGGQQGGMGGSIRNAAKKSGLEDTIENAAAALMGSLTEQLKGTLDQRLPGYAEKMDTAQQSSGSFTDKAKATQQEAQQQ